MKTDKYFKTEISKSCQSPAASLWKVLTDPEITPKYMYNCVVQSTWQVGDAIIWQGEYQGYKAYQKGIILAKETHKMLKYTTFDPNYGMEDIPENYIHITYQLQENGSGTLLHIKNETFDGRKERAEEIRNGWEEVLEKICILPQNEPASIQKE